MLLIFRVAILQQWFFKCALVLLCNLKMENTSEAFRSVCGIDRIKCGKNSHSGNIRIFTSNSNKIELLLNNSESGEIENSMIFSNKRRRTLTHPRQRNHVYRRIFVSVFHSRCCLLLVLLFRSLFDSIFISNMMCHFDLDAKMCAFTLRYCLQVYSFQGRTFNQDQA